jgi:hypothetical protein
MIKNMHIQNYHKFTAHWVSDYFIKEAKKQNSYIRNVTPLIYTDFDANNMQR